MDSIQSGGGEGEMMVRRHWIAAAVALLALMSAFFPGVPLAGQLAPLAGEASSLAPVGQAGTWDLIFNDEFDGTALNLSKWRPNWLGGSDTAITKPVNSAETSCYDPQQVSVQNGELDLTAVARTCSSWRFASGMVQSNGKFSFTYGYVEARIWTPAGAGVWPAFWTDGQKWPTDGEIDVLEAYGTNRSTYHYHYAGCGGDCGPGGAVDVAGATSGWHTYAADWRPGAITWYYDGKPVWSYTTGIVSSPHYLILNLGLNSTSSTLPAKMRVDYVRVWKPGTSTTAPTPTRTTTSVSTVYTDSLTGWKDASLSASVNYLSTAFKQSGSYSVNFKATAPLGAWSVAPTNGAFNTTNYTHVRLWVNGGYCIGHKLGISLAKNGVWGPRVDLIKYLPAQRTIANTWQMADVPLSALGASNSVINRLMVMDTSGTTQGSVWLDNAQFIRK
jgi:beta-glucanase (GH16 family)